MSWQSWMHLLLSESGVKWGEKKTGVGLTPFFLFPPLLSLYSLRYTLFFLFFHHFLPFLFSFTHSHTHTPTRTDRHMHTDVTQAWLKSLKEMDSFMNYMSFFILSINGATFVSQNWLHVWLVWGLPFVELPLCQDYDNKCQLCLYKDHGTAEIATDSPYHKIP